MAGAAATVDRPPVGRVGEIEAVVEFVRAADAGTAGSLLLSGEAGVGKTALVREACRRVEGAADVVWAPCLPLASLAAPFLPLRSGVREWAAANHSPAPSFADLGGSAAAEGPARFDAWLDGVCQRRALLLVVDDLHWADQSTLDVLMYVVAGPAERRLAVIATLRTGEVGEGHPLRRWLADVRRLPRVDDLDLARLDRVATGQQIENLLGSPPHQSLVDEVFGRTGGNPYLTSLLVRDVPADTQALPAGLPSRLAEALARTWHGLSPPTRELTRLVAVAGRPQRAAQLRPVARVLGVSPDVVPLLREAVDAAVLTVDLQERYWFAHPLLAEVLTDGLLPEERRERHAAFAEVLAPAGTPGPMPVDHVVDLADHYHRAGHVRHAYAWALRAAAEAEHAGGASEMLRLLRRALGLHGQVADVGDTRRDLLDRIRAAAERSGELAHELAAVDELLDIMDPRIEPLQVAELRVRRMHLLLMTGTDFASLAEVREAVRLTTPYPDSPQHALAMAELAHAELWHDVPGGPARARQAVRLARACGWPRPLSFALTAHVFAGCQFADGGGLEEAREAKAAAARARDFFAFVHAALWEGNCLDVSASPAWQESIRRSREELTSLGSPHTYVAWLCAAEAEGLLLTGDWRACAQRLRVALGSNPGPGGDVYARLAAANLACWQGRQAEAGGHLARAEELFAEQSGFMAFPFDAVRAELSVAEGDTDGAVAAALAGAAQDAPPTWCERLLPLAARALADQAQRLRDQKGDPARALARLDDLRSRHPDVLVDPGPGEIYQIQVRAMRALYDAESHRAHADPATGHAFHDAAQTCRAGGLAWHEAYASWRTAQAVLRDRRPERKAARAALRRAHELATDLQARPIQQDVEALARLARIPLTPASGSPADAAAAIPNVTRREREVLAHLVAGRTYHEIAKALFISDKTVSAHISNMLRKTGSTSSIELAELARRLAQGQRDGG